MRLLAVVSAMIVWAVWFVVVYGLTGVGCNAGWHEVRLPMGNLLALLMLLSTAVALLLMTGCARHGYLAWRGSCSGSQALEATQRLRFTGLAMFLLSVLAGIGTVMISVPVFMLDPCAA